MTEGITPKIAEGRLTQLHMPHCPNCPRATSLKINIPLTEQPWDYAGLGFGFVFVENVRQVYIFICLLIQWLMLKKSVLITAWIVIKTPEKKIEAVWRSD